MSRAEIRVEGFIASELEVRNAGDHRVVEVVVPHTPSRKTDQGQWEDTGPTTWFQASFWNEHVDAVLDSVSKGDLVVLSGSVELEAYTKRDGSPGAKVLVKHPVLSRVVRKPRSDASGGSWAAQGPGNDLDTSSDVPASYAGDQSNASTYTDTTPF